MSMRSNHLFLSVTITALAASAALAQDGAPRSQEPPAGKDNRAVITPQSPEMAVLESITGTWRVIERHIDEAGKETVVKGNEEVLWVLDGNAVRRTYVSGAASPKYEAVGMLTWNAATKRFEGSWFDNTQPNGPTTVAATWDADKHTMTYSLTATGPDGKPIHFETLDKVIDEEHRTATTFRRDGQRVVKVMEVTYERMIPCPQSTRFIPLVDPELKRLEPSGGKSD